MTPPVWSKGAKMTLSSSLHVVVPGVGHNTVILGCVEALMADFVRQGRVGGLKLPCGSNLTRPPFFTSFASPVP